MSRFDRGMSRWLLRASRSILMASLAATVSVASGFSSDEGAGDPALAGRLRDHFLLEHRTDLGLPSLDGPTLTGYLGEHFAIEHRAELERALASSSIDARLRSHFAIEHRGDLATT